ncbi:endoplasmic reticulum-Golgi intermediate compartment protein 1 [Marmota monax]|uniref:Endoplasmic reticulum-Golgi intermediate compartment protein n=1 Tax=Marmota monax TaxID=9995 RepID=A0A834Q4U1_MARMO|nr:endoplasmic reticulum-Golgi intermediate compartment protein 1 [Marmota monax]
MPFDFRRFDIYRKVPKDLTQPTYTGAIISICCCLFILFLFLSELTGFITTEVVNELYVDDPDKDSGGKIDVSLNISLPNLHCELVGLDIQDEMGRHEVGHIDNSMKIPLNNGVGCRFEGQFSINKVPGNFHVSTHSATAQPQNPDMTHIIHKLSFGDTLQVQNVHGAFNALGGADRLNSNPLASHDYILKIVPTVYEDKNGKQRYSYQYTVANKEYVAYSHTGRIIPAIWFRYDLSPITVKYTERRQPLYRFITTAWHSAGRLYIVPTPVLDLGVLMEAPACLPPAASNGTQANQPDSALQASTWGARESQDLDLFSVVLAHLPSAAHILICS